MNQEPYEHVRKMLHCGHAYAKISDYDTSLRAALAKLSRAGTDAEHDGWFRACVIIREVAVLRFGLEAEAMMQQAANDFAKQETA